MRSDAREARNSGKASIVDKSKSASKESPNPRGRTKKNLAVDDVDISLSDIAAA